MANHPSLLVLLKTIDSYRAVLFSEPPQLTRDANDLRFYTIAVSSGCVDALIIRGVLLTGQARLPLYRTQSTETHDYEDRRI